MAFTTPIQTANNNTGGAGSGTLNVVFGSALTAGSVVVMHIGSAGAVSITGTGITWVIYTSQGTSTTISNLAIGRVFSGASSTITITCSVTTGGIAATAAEWAGVNVRSDQEVFGTATGTSAASGNSPSTTNANELILCGISARNAVTYSSPTNSFSIAVQDKSSIGTVSDRSSALLYKVVSSTGAQNGGATLSTSSVWVSQVLTVEETPTGGVLITPGMNGGINS